jgi:hypothetical protein
MVDNGQVLFFMDARGGSFSIGAFGMASNDGE